MKKSTHRSQVEKGSSPFLFERSPLKRNKSEQAKAGRQLLAESIELISQSPLNPVRAGEVVPFTAVSWAAAHLSTIRHPDQKPQVSPDVQGAVVALGIFRDEIKEAVSAARNKSPEHFFNSLKYLGARSHSPMWWRCWRSGKTRSTTPPRKRGGKRQQRT